VAEVTDEVHRAVDVSVDRRSGLEVDHDRAVAAAAATVGLDVVVAEDHAVLAFQRKVMGRDRAAVMAYVEEARRFFLGRFGLDFAGVSALKPSGIRRRVSCDSMTQTSSSRVCRRWLGPRRPRMFANRCGFVRVRADE
jgi:hypothetical protein